METRGTLLWHRTKRLASISCKRVEKKCTSVRCDSVLTAASLSKRAKSSLRVITSSCAVHWDARLVKPSMSANKMLRKTQREKRGPSVLWKVLMQRGRPLCCLLGLQTGVDRICEPLFPFRPWQTESDAMTEEDRITQELRGSSCKRCMMPHGIQGCDS